MAKHDTGPVHGTVLNGALISERRYFSEPSPGPLGWEYIEDDRGPFARLLGST
jgi:hypothetical protein